KPNTEERDNNRTRTLNYKRTLSFLSAEEDTISTISVAIADNDQERSQGLMDVRNLPADKGMLFIFEENKPRGFWMANTPLPLDIIFVNADKEIVRIHHNAQPFSEKSLTTDKPAQYVIETNAGYTVSHDVQEGQKVAF
ncbi:MAG TPA: DUF192 domain-containing protein, partial [Fodinibius sp.]|nr:DUF192 domain-containing protein [Fodinibius sp.]